MDWKTYLSPTLGRETLGRCGASYRGTFVQGRQMLIDLCDRLKPRRIACLGAGYLNDLPVARFLEHGSEILLVDWIPRISERGFASDLIRSSEDSPECRLCRLAQDPAYYCSGFGGLTEQGAICTRFLADAKQQSHCQNWRPGEQPRFLIADATLGRATAFARRVTTQVPSTKNPKQAFRRASEAARLAGSSLDRIDIEGGTMDLVTSSMLASQFDHEPYDYFSVLVESRFGRDRILAESDTLRPLMEKLRSSLFRIQMEGHALELYRLVEKTHGRVFFSVEMLRADGGRDSFFLVHEVPRAMEILGRHFTFDMDATPLSQTLHEIEIGGGTSIVQNYVLKPRQTPAA